MKFYHWQKCHKMQIHFFVPQGVEIKLIFGLWAAIFEIFEISIFRHGISNLKKSRKVPYIYALCFYPKWVEVKLIFALRVAVFEIRADFQNSIRHDIWNLEKGPKLVYTLFLPHGVEIDLIFGLRAAIFEVQAYFQNFRIWAWNLDFEGRSKSFIFTLLPQGVEIKHILVLRAAVRDTAHFKISIHGHEIWNVKQGPN